MISRRNTDDARFLAEAEAPAAVEPLVPVELLDDGEAIILAVKPSGWFVVLTSWPVLLSCAAVATAAGLWLDTFGGNLVGMAALAVALAKMLVACFQWVGRLYVLTNRRVIGIRGVLKANVVSYPLKNIRRTALSATLPERMVAVSSLYFDISDADDGTEMIWVDLAKPSEVRDLVEQAIHQTR